MAVPQSLVSHSTRLIWGLTPRAWVRWFFTLLLIAAAVAHFVLFDFFLTWFPPYIPYPALWIYGTGVLEAVLALTLQIPRLRNASGWVIFVMLDLYILVHVYAITGNHLHAQGPYAIPLWLAWLRLPLQLPLLYGAWWCSRKP